MSAPLLLSPKAAAKHAGLGRDETYARVRSGEIPSLRVGRRYLIPVAALDAWVAQIAEGGDASENTPQSGPTTGPTE